MKQNIIDFNQKFYRQLYFHSRDRFYQSLRSDVYDHVRHEYWNRQHKLCCQVLNWFPCVDYMPLRDKPAWLRVQAM